ncbi:hypothetical protein [Polaromonas sp. CG_9.11]|uniref:hypothetical protein n=1 Tax=Polaromonas sp. CG_9.11 TaxID=2787730 RepID=UPI001A34C509|nr:hypothetical protein [Polaromonas sp. CG_9.11]
MNVLAEPAQALAAAPSDPEIGALAAALFTLAPGEHALCFVSIGTVQCRKTARLRPVPADFARTLLPGGGTVVGF